MEMHSTVQTDSALSQTGANRQQKTNPKSASASVPVQTKSAATTKGKSNSFTLKPLADIPDMEDQMAAPQSLMMAENKTKRARPENWQNSWPYSEHATTFLNHNTTQDTFNVNLFSMTRRLKSGIPTVTFDAKLLPAFTHHFQANFVDILRHLCVSANDALQVFYMSAQLYSQLALATPGKTKWMYNDESLSAISFDIPSSEVDLSTRAKQLEMDIKTFQLHQLQLKASTHAAALQSEMVQVFNSLSDQIIDKCYTYYQVKNPTVSSLTLPVRQSTPVESQWEHQSIVLPTIFGLTNNTFLTNSYTYLPFLLANFSSTLKQLFEDAWSDGECVTMSAAIKPLPPPTPKKSGKTQSVITLDSEPDGSMLVKTMTLIQQQLKELQQQISKPNKPTKKRTTVTKHKPKQQKNSR